jgi:plastocyanin
MKNNNYVRAAFLMLVVLVGGMALAPRLASAVLKGADAETPVREIHVVAKEMTFYVEGETTPNPTLHAAPGERIRLVLRNSDPGMSHDFTIRSWSVGTRLLKGKGEDRIEFTVPETRGSHAYSCTPHSEMMGGTIQVQ